MLIMKERTWPTLKSFENFKTSNPMSIALRNAEPRDTSCACKLRTPLPDLEGNYGV